MNSTPPKTSHWGSFIEQLFNRHVTYSSTLGSKLVNFTHHAIIDLFFNTWTNRKRQRAEFSGSWQQGHSATYNTPPRAFKSSAKDSTRRWKLYFRRHLTLPSRAIS
ncbi:hypothetical protein H5410_064043 [Solanum commersonii]|uniref:Uncharacterized protein n=1 Tax=Solanum commersonii TaxID=4109 RepID=A0A9J5W0W6_SOLCO|nr:hypothetical protein H5410_064043 [Solanum commersonii]